MMIASLASIIQLSLTFLHVPDEARINNHQALYLVSIGLIFVFPSRALTSCINLLQPLQQGLLFT